MVLRENKWSVFLTRFAGHVSSGAYKKTNYSAWRDMKSWHGADIWINGGKYTVEDIDCPFNYHDFDAKDGSFGQYINDVWLEQSSNIETKFDHMVHADNYKTINKIVNNDDKIYTDEKPVQYTLDPDGVIRYVKEPTGLTASVSAENNTCSTAITSNSTNTINSVKVSPVIEGTMFDYNDCIIKDDTINGVIGKWDAIDMKIDEFVSKDEFYEIVEDMKNRLATKMDIEHYNNEKENNNMKMFSNFDFGKVDGNKVRMSMYGLAVRNQAGTWVSYDVNTGNVIDVDPFNMDGSQFMYKMPVALSQVNKGDMIIHNCKPVYVTGKDESGKLVVVDIFDGEEKMILPTKNMFGFNFATKVVSLMDMAGMGKPDAENPFGNMWMLALMGDGKDFDMKDFMMLNMMNGNAGAQMNPMLALMMMGDKDTNLMMAMAMSGMFNQKQ